MKFNHIIHEPLKGNWKGNGIPRVFYHTSTNYPQMLNMLTRNVENLISYMFTFLTLSRDKWLKVLHFCWDHKKFGQIFPCSSPFILEMRVFKKHMRFKWQVIVLVLWFIYYVSDLEFNFVSSLTLCFLKGEKIWLSENWEFISNLKWTLNFFYHLIYWYE